MTNDVRTPTPEAGKHVCPDCGERFACIRERMTPDVACCIRADWQCSHCWALSEGIHHEERLSHD